MASAFSHAIASIPIVKIALTSYNPSSEESTIIGSWKLWLLAAFCAAIPDIDAIGFWMGVPYDSLWGHRGITHSFFFAALLALVVTFSFYRSAKPFSKIWWFLIGVLFLATASHPFLDALTTGGKGVAFFAPFYDERYFFPWRVIKVSPISITRFFSSKGIQVLESEFVWVWMPSAVIFLIASALKPRKATI